MKSTSYVLSFRMVFFYLVTAGWIFDISLLCENSTKSINQVDNLEFGMNYKSLKFRPDLK